MAISETIPSITHVAVTVTDLDRSEAWYTKVLGAAPVLDEDTGPFRHIVYSVGTTLLGLHGFPELVEPRAVQRAARRPRPHRIRRREPRRARAVGGSPRLAGHRPWRGQGRRLRLGSVVPRSRQHRSRAVRCSGVSPDVRSLAAAAARRRYGPFCEPSTGTGMRGGQRRSAARHGELDAGRVEGLAGPPEALGRRVQLTARRLGIAAGRRDRGAGL